MITLIGSPDETVLSRNQIIFALKSTDDNGDVYDTLPDNYRVELEVYLRGEAIIIQQDIPAPDGISSIDISSTLHAAFFDTRENKLPNFSSPIPYDPDIIRPFYVRYREVYTGNTPSWTNSDTHLVLIGGVSKFYDATTNVFSNFDADNSLLSWYPATKFVSKDQREYITWYNYTGSDKTDIALEVTVTYDDGTTTNYLHLATDPLVVLAGRVITIPVGYQDVGVDAIMASLGITQEVLRYAVRVRSGNDPVSQWRYYDIDCAMYPESRQILYFNGYGVPEVTRFVGELSEDLDVDRKEAVATLTPAYTSTDHGTYQYDQNFKIPLTFRSGYNFSKAEVKALQELLIYNDAYDIRSYGYMPIRITSNKFKTTQTLRFLHTLEFKAESRMAMHAYDNLDTDDDAVEISPLYWQEEDGSFWLQEDGQPWEHE